MFLRIRSILEPWDGRLAKAKEAGGVVADGVVVLSVLLLWGRVSLAFSFFSPDNRPKTPPIFTENRSSSPIEKHLSLSLSRRFVRQLVPVLVLRILPLVTRDDALLVLV
jgi:hypothetical protein